ncbi:2Fe-2S iron-sulfur cluster-binding protein [Pedobacter nanyangensis]|uniref:2Fe-2S iron-sulfur cluster-binding protein n=1 Tax=Pedobacter nanyangensis TaxID=1562389 RepID=UPI000DE2B149|nr:2Fe-2S iron-sulfur cluster-binding protein [Pedobacter nanyangensis]
MSDINITVEDREGNVTDLVAPTDMGLSLMEFLKASEYDVLATCGGMALCATCCVDVLEGEEKLHEMSDDEYAMLDTLPDLLPNSRLACQIQLKPELEGLKVRLHAMDY